MISMRTESGRVSRTQLWNAVVMTIGALVGLLPTLQESIPLWLYPWVFVAVKLIDTFLRQITSEPMG